MSLFDRYLLRQFLWIWIVCFCSLTGLYIIIDAFGNLEEFLSYAEKSGANLAAVLIEYYGYRAIAFFDRTSGILTLIAAMFTIAGLQRYQEFTALLAAGISPWRVVRPVVCVGVVIALLAAASRELIIPRLRDQFSRTAQDLGSTAKRELKPRPDYWSGVMLRGRQLSLADETIVEPSLQLPRTAPPDLGRTVNAKSARYEEATADHSVGYRLSGVTLPKDAAAKSSWRFPTGEDVLITPHDAPWLAADELFLASEVSFELLVDPASWRQYAGTLELIGGLHNRGMDYGNDVRVTVHARLLQPALDSLLILLGLPLLLRGQNRNVFIAVGLCVGLVIAFMLVTLGCQYLGSSYLISPALGAWLPLFLFVPLTVFNGEVLWE